jgi:hypothetical protein
MIARDKISNDKIFPNRPKTLDSGRQKLHARAFSYILSRRKEDTAMPSHVQKLNFGHDAIIDWLLANPDKNQGDCASAFNYTQAWLSRIVNSDLFQVEYQRRLAEKRDRLDGELALDIRRVARKSIQAVERRLDSGACSDAFLMKSMDHTLAVLGYTQEQGNVPAAGPVSPTVQVNIIQEDINRARERALSHTGGTVPAKIINGEVSQQRLSYQEKDE